MTDYPSYPSKFPMISNDKKVNASAYMLACTLIVGTISSSIGTLTQTDSDDMRRMQKVTNDKVEDLILVVTESDKRQEELNLVNGENSAAISDWICEENGGCPHPSWPSNRLTWEEPPDGASSPKRTTNKPWSRQLN